MGKLILERGDKTLDQMAKELDIPVSGVSRFQAEYLQSIGSQTGTLPTSIRKRDKSEVSKALVLSPADENNQLRTENEGLKVELEHLRSIINRLEGQIETQQVITSVLGEHIKNG